MGRLQIPWGALVTITTSRTTSDSIQASGKRRVSFEFEDHNGDTYLLSGLDIDQVVDVDALRLSKHAEIENDLAEREVLKAISDAIAGNNPDRTAEHQTQASFDRRFLGRSMQLDAQPFYNCLPVYQRVLTQGNNAGQRAAYLGVPTADFNLIDTRYTNVMGIAWFLNDEKQQTWSKLPENFR